MGQVFVEITDTIRFALVYVYKNNKGNLLVHKDELKYFTMFFFLTNDGLPTQLTPSPEYPL